MKKTIAKSTAKKAPAKKGDTKRRWGGMRPIGAHVPSLTRKALGKRGFLQISLITDWDKIVGEDIARQSQPDKLVFPRGSKRGAVLHIRVSGVLAPEMQHLEPVLIERINGFFGYQAVGRFKLHQVPLRYENIPSPPKKPAPPLNEDQVKKLDHLLEDCDDPELKATLARFGENIMRRKNAKKR